MSPQRDTMITRQAWEQHMKNKDSQWTLEDLMITSKTESQSALTATSMDIWQRNAKQRRKNEKPGSVSNATRKDTLPKTTKESRQ